jgi:hypothetical protein
MTAPADRLAALDDYVTGHMPDADAARFEEALFDAPDDDAAFSDGLARTITLMARSPLWDGGRREHVEQLRAAGLTVHYADLGSGGAPTTLPVWAAGTQIVVVRLGVDLRGYDGADVEVKTADGRPIKTFRDVVCDPSDGALYAVCQEPLAQYLFRQRRINARVVGTRGARRETVAVFDIVPTP